MHWKVPRDFVNKFENTFQDNWFFKVILYFLVLYITWVMGLFGKRLAFLIQFKNGFTLHKGREERWIVLRGDLFMKFSVHKNVLINIDGWNILVKVVNKINFVCTNRTCLEFNNLIHKDYSVTLIFNN